MTTTTDENGRHQRNGHTLELRECDWRCLQCGHWFDAATDAGLFWCGEDCAGRHPGDIIAADAPEASESATEGRG